MKTPLLRAQSIGKSFGSIEAVKDASFDVLSGGITALLGSNGAGKTTLLKLALGFLLPDSGRISLAAERVGYVPEQPAFFPWLRGDQILQCTLRSFGLAGRTMDAEIENLCSRLAFDPRLLGRKVQAYSLGNKKKFSYLQSLLLRPDLLIIDEPFSALDPDSIRRARSIFQELRSQGKALLLSSHLISELEKVCDDFIIIRSGRVVLQENLPKLRESHVFLRFARSQQGMWASIPAPCFHKTTDRFVEWLFPRSRVREIGHPLMEAAEIRPPDLELVYFFLAD